MLLLITAYKIDLVVAVRRGSKIVRHARRLAVRHLRGNAEIATDAAYRQRSPRGGGGAG